MRSNCEVLSSNINDKRKRGILYEIAPLAMHQRAESAYTRKATRKRPDESQSKVASAKADTHLAAIRTQARSTTSKTC